MAANKLNRRDFITTTGLAASGALLINPLETNASSLFSAIPKKRLAMVGTGVRGISMFGKSIVENYANYVEFVGLCDINPGRLEYGKKFMGVTCPTYTDFELMMKETRPDTLIVTTVDATHDTFIIKGMELGADIISEKPMTTDEFKTQAIIDAEKKYGKKVTVTFNYRYSPHRAKMYELLRNNAIGKLTSVDFHWYLDTSHGADYFRRWHRLVEQSGSLWVHKATHHFDLLNWWIDSDPKEVYANAALEFYGKNNAFRHTNCRSCPHKTSCKFFWDMTKNEHLMNLYAANEQFDGYLRDGCVWREDINIYDKMAATIKYMNGVHVSYSLTAYSPYEGYRIAFNGTEGRIDAWIQESNPSHNNNYDEIMLTRNFGTREYFQIPQSEGHGGGDKLLKDRLFVPGTADPMRQSAGTRDGALSCLIGIAARNSCKTGQPVQIENLTSLKPQEKKM